jgi:DNA-binding IclR family transcriptional regulator
MSDSPGIIPPRPKKARRIVAQAEEKSPQRERGVDRLIAILDFIHRQGKPVRIADLAEGLNAPRSTIYDLVRVLTAAGLLESRGEGAVFFGSALYFYGADYLREHDIFRRGREEVDRLAQETGEMCQFCVPHNGKFTVAHMRYGTRSFNISSGIGIEIPIPWTASGRLFCAGLSDEAITERFAPEDFILPNGQVIPAEDFIASVRLAERQGYFIASGLVDVYTHCIAAPVFDERGQVIASMCFIVLIDTPEKRIAELRDTLIACGKALSMVR